MTDLTHLADTPAGIELDRIAAGEPVVTSAIAGLQFHSYARPNGLDGLVMPSAGDKLTLVRAPDNPFDGNAIEVWWRNEHRLGHLPRILAADLASVLDAGRSVRAYVLDAGTGCAWSARVLLVGEGVRVVIDEDLAWEARRRPVLEPWQEEDGETRTVQAPSIVPDLDDEEFPF